jgi:subtilase family serine protease
VSFNVVNQGTVTAGSLQVKIYLSRNTSVSSDDVLLRTRTFGTVPARATLPNSLTESVPSNVGTGAYFLLFVVDANGSVGESNEGNNIASRAITVR